MSATRLGCNARADKNPCPAKNDSSVPDNDVSKRIDEIVQEGITRRHQKAIVDYTFTSKPFPFSEIAAVKSENHSEAYFMLTFADRNYTAADVQAKYGAPYDTDVVQWYSVFKYRVESPHYTSKASVRNRSHRRRSATGLDQLESQESQGRKEQSIAIHNLE